LGALVSHSSLSLSPHGKEPDILCFSVWVALVREI